MPIQNDNVIISPNDFLENNKRGEFYTGHVFGLGYAFVQHLPVEVFSGTDCYHPIIDIQCIDQSEECIQEGFDIVIGNPPYVFARENISQFEKNYYSNVYNSAKYQINTYLLFMEKTIKLIKNNGFYG